MTTEDSGHMTFPEGEDGDLLRSFVSEYEVGDVFELRITGSLKDVTDEGFSFTIDSATSDEFYVDEMEEGEDLDDDSAMMGDDSGDAIVALLSEPS